MNIKNLRKNYHRLSKRERLILYDSAENRDDQSEMDAILTASPKKDWTQPDFTFEAEKILKLRLVLLIFRLKYSRAAMFWYSLFEAETRRAKNQENDKFFYNSARLNAYLYCVCIDSANSLFEEIGLDIEAWETRQREMLGVDLADEIADLQMRELAFDEKEAEQFIEKIGKASGTVKAMIGNAYERELKSLRELFKKQGFRW